jgi:hypothetical protein
MRPIATIALMLILGVTNVYAHEKHVKMKFSGTSAASTIDLQEPDPSNLQQPATNNDEDNFAGNGTLGSFTFRNVKAIAKNPTTSSTCSGANQFYFQDLVGAGVFRFADGSLLYVRLTQGGDCIDFTALEAHCTLTLEVTGGTGRFRNASGTLTFTETAVPVLADAKNNPVLFAATGEFTGTVSGVREEESQGEEQ